MPASSADSPEPLNRPRLAPRSGLLLLALMIGASVLIAVGNPLRSPSAPAPAGTTAAQAAVCPVGAARAGAVFDFRAEGFRVWFPCPPNRIVRSANAVPFGEIEIVSYEAEADGVQYAAAFVNYADKLPAAAFDLARGIVLDGAKRSLVRSQPVQNPVFTDAMQSGLSGALVRAAGPEKKLRGAVWLARQVTYQLIALAPVGLADEAPLDHFISTFEALPLATSVAP